MKKLTVTKNITISATSALAGTSGTVILKQDDVGTHIISLATGNIGSITLNTLARAITRLDWIRTDEYAYWTSTVLDAGLTQTVVPVIRLDDLNNTIKLFTSFANSDIVMSVNNGDWVPYTGTFSIEPIDYPAGYWKFKVIEAVGRLESAVVSSLAAHAIPGGFPYTFSFPLSSQ